jgi:4-hydroxy-2-oxoheptanedioate aldolase
MDIKKRDFLTGTMAVGAGLAAAAGAASTAANAQVPAGVPKATGKTMLDSPNFIGDASKGGGFRKSWARALPQVSTTDPNYKPRRINKAIELWEDNQVAFYNVYWPSGAPDGYEEGKRMAQTYCDVINYEMENGCFDFANLRNFMQGLADGGPTPSGHRTPMVYVTLSATGFNGAAMRANGWQIHQALAAGAHGVLMVEMESPEAGEIAISCARYKFTLPGIKEYPIEGSRGAGSQVFAQHIWGLKGDDYLAVADPWPANPKGEISMGFKLENRHAVENAEQLMAIRGLAFAEPGPSDNSWSILGWDAIKPMSREERAQVLSTPIYVDALDRVRLAALKNGIKWLGTGKHGATMNESYDQGMRMLPGDNEEVVRASREYSKRKMPA